MLSAALAADVALAPLEGWPALLLAVSGGPDSVALMLLAQRWTRGPARENIVVATVDHGLRAGARDEARQVAHWAQSLGFAHRLLTWEGPKPATRLQECAREARYALLADCAREAHSTCAIVTAHHADDQAETILFRLTRGSGVAGLGGMASASARQDVALLRPLLGVTKAALEAVCIEAGHPFLRDPSNDDAIFARARLRKLGATLETLGLNRDALLRLGDRAARAEAALVWSARRAREAALISQGGAGAQFSAVVLRELPREMLLRLLATEIVTLRGAAARLDRLERAAETLAYHLDRGVAGRTTLAGVSIRWDNLTVTLTLAPPRAAQRKTQDKGAENGI